ncbi:MAG TPA: hypothetical protein VHC22_08040 [Pirellulales bacterium]|nr:hypothetical protein [Pirellulales bacterium]
MLAVATVALAASDVRKATASCGDYVLVNGHTKGSHAVTDHSRSLPVVPICHGPNCHDRAPLSVPPTKGLPNSPPVDAAYCQQTDRLAEPSLSDELFERPVLCSENHFLPLLRPPCC